MPHIKQIELLPLLPQVDNQACYATHMAVGLLAIGMPKPPTPGQIDEIIARQPDSPIFGIQKRPFETWMLSHGLRLNVIKSRVPLPREYCQEAATLPLEFGVAWHQEVNGALDTYERKGTYQTHTVRRITSKVLQRALSITPNTFVSVTVPASNTTVHCMAVFSAQPRDVYCFNPGLPTSALHKTTVEAVAQHLLQGTEIIAISR